MGHRATLPSQSISSSFNHDAQEQVADDHDATAAPGALTQRAVALGFAVLLQQDQERQAKRARYASIAADSADEDEQKAESPSPVLDLFLQTVGADGVQELTNFSLEQIDGVWADVRAFVASHWNVGRGNKCKVAGMDVLFMTLTTLKHCGRWDTVAHVFKFKSSTFEKMVLNYLTILAPHLYDIYVDAVASQWPMDRVVRSGLAFPHHPSARYATTTTFQQTNTPSGTQADRAPLFSTKHKLHGFKVEVSVLPVGLAINCTEHYPGSEADADIFRKNLDFHEANLHKSPSDEELLASDDGGALADEFSVNEWAVLADKSYEALVGEAVCVVHPLKEPPPGGRALTRAEAKQNREIASDRSVVDKFLGRLRTLWAVCSDRYRWSSKHYDTIFRACLALTNVHAREKPLYADDGDKHREYVQRLWGIGAESRANRIEIQKRSREKRKSRVESAVASAGLSVSHEL